MSSNRVEKLKLKYQNLEQAEQKILMFFSYFNSPLSVGVVYKLLELYQIKDERRYNLSQKKVKGSIDNLKKLGFLTNYFGGEIVLSDEISTFIFEELIKNPFLKSIQELTKANKKFMADNRLYLTQLEDFRVAIYTGDFSEFDSKSSKEVYSDYHRMNLFTKAIKSGLDITNLLGGYVAGQKIEYIEFALLYYLNVGKDLSQFIKCLNDLNIDSPSIDLSKGFYHFMRAEWQELEVIIEENKEYSDAVALHAFYEVVKGQYDLAIELYDRSTKLWRKENNKKKGYSTTFSMLGYALALAKVDKSKFITFYEDYYTFHQKSDLHTIVFELIVYFYNYYIQSSKVKRPNTLAPTIFSYFGLSIINALFKNASLPFSLTTALPYAESNNYVLLETEILNAIAKREQEKHTQTNENRLAALQAQTGVAILGNLLEEQADWQRALLMLQKAADSMNKGVNTKEKSNVRLAWGVDLQMDEVWPIEQKLQKNGTWSSGRRVALKRLYNDELDYLTEQDRLVVQKSLQLQTSYNDWGYNSNQYLINSSEAYKLLCEHPHLYLQKGTEMIPFTLSKGEVILQVKSTKSKLLVKFDEKIESSGVKLIKQTPNHYKLVEITPAHVAIKNAFGNNTLEVPLEAKNELLKSLELISKKVIIQSDLEEQFESLPLLEADDRIYALINPKNEGFLIEFFIKPFSKKAMFLPVGKGSETLVSTVDDVRVQLKRNLKKERKNYEAILEQCPTLGMFESGNNQWTVDSPNDCLTILQEMAVPFKQGKLVIEWPKGQKINYLGEINTQNLSLKVKSQTDWFEVSGEAKLDDKLVLSLRDILEKLDTNANFIELSEGQFIAITEKLRKQLQLMNRVLDNKMRGNMLLSETVEDISNDLDSFKADKAWLENLKRIKNIRDTTYEVPKTFDAQLRPYQLEGYQWLARLSEWGVGACLADDMGLGKTVQSLALLLKRAELGPALVIAPVSVCRNWESEALKFAPTLNVLTFATASNRAEMLESAGAFDIVIASYGLLQSEEKLFTKKKFATILLDEAQAIKNKATKRSKVVMALDGDFKIATTGTPVENHLGELWNLFRFLNPSLLGSHDTFQEKFSNPIERYQDKDAQKALQKFVKPFILRRRKNQVLDDLPAKTEIVLNIEMSVEERSFYESLRQSALERLTSEEEGQDKRFKILAELTKLRLACCNPKLVNEEVPIGSSKLEAFVEILEELRENNHRALVFSQFVKHLEIIKQYLTENGIAYQYLDGSTPANKRQESIDAFQKGTGDVFLISLKAGGVGLNLTAADYVIHLDPWWNPAVEDQATDRAHRIGQQRPVTVYRLVTADTVESKILKLHETKRDLADSLLEGTEGSGKLSADELLALIREI
ncbi:DEAD/DEAH box helicase [Flectobacillus sp. BAB-3569]|uniref:DEAD/DEAH box helicase n=1 Tax=Flectobacillus sp. BAB-3569 TaxID=1509483 RepID=UPI000BA4406C|nr:DEAD/DEAH box helicase [Flectobacillus sp. BAB-3569]PAC27937.1 helicase [Flectobacillus sp. BAB-3569]